MKSDDTMLTVAVLEFLLTHMHSCFVLQSLSVVFFLSFIVQILYYYGAMQWVVLNLGWLLQKSMGTTVCESVNAAASIFLSMVIIPTYLITTLLSRLVWFKCSRFVLGRCQF